MKTIDTRGLLCPAPLIQTKKALKEAQTGDRFEIILDNDTACSNVASYLRELGINCDVILEEKCQYIRLTVEDEVMDQSNKPETCTIDDKGITQSYSVILKSTTMGEGDPELGTLLLRAFLNTLKENEVLPQYIILYNSGVKLAVNGTDSCNALIEMENKGVNVICCGTCVDFYDLKQQIGVGTISNMYKIIECSVNSSKLIYP
ncbi:MAG: sulfurtransferase-like selenium metabolism protein YedF [Bacteroidales bacterium]